MKVRTNRFVPRLEVFEDRIVPTWPIAPQNQQEPVLSAYGQFQEFGGIHFHEGVDVVAPVTTNVLAIEAGTIVGTFAAPLAYSSFVVVNAGGGNSLNYIHVVPGNKPAANNPATPQPRPWQANDTVNVGDPLGTVAQIPLGAQFPAHIHLDRGGPQDPYWAHVSTMPQQPPQLSALRTPTSNPLSGVAPNNNFLNPKVDDFDPVVNSIHFLVAADDRNGQTASAVAPGDPAATFTETPRTDNQYFSTPNAQNQLIVGARAATAAVNNTVGTGSGQIDIIGEIWDQFGPQGNVVLNSNKLGVQDVWFKIQGPNATTNWVHSFSFAGVFLDDRGIYGAMAPPDDYRAFRTSELTRTVYEYDQFSRSTQSNSSWYIVTNTASVNGTPNLVVAASRTNGTDRDRFWNSTVAAGNPWNARAAPPGAAPAATSNATSEFPDDIYTVTIAADDAAGNEGDKTVSILLDNWQQTVTTTANQYAPNQNVIVNGGAQYRANQTVDIYAIPIARGATAPADGIALPAANRVAAGVNANATGNLPAMTNLGMLPAGRYAIIVDYNRDGTFTNGLDAYKVILVVAPQPPPLNAPVNAVPSAQATNEDTALVFSVGHGNPINNSDPYVGANPIQVTLTATNGTLTLSGASGLTFVSGTGSGDASMTFTGTVSDINAALAGLMFSPSLHYSGTASVEIYTDDLGNNGSGTDQTADNIIDITLNAVYNPPVANDDSYSGYENNWIMGNVRDNDTDVANDVLTVTSVNGTTDFLNGPVTLSLGTLEIGTDGYFVFQPNANATGNSTFSYTITDGRGGYATANVSIVVVNGQWASSVVGFSSQYSATNWAATQALGAPDTLTYGDIGTAWAPLPMNGTLEWINLGFTTPVYATGVTIRETDGNGFVYQVDLVDTSGGLHTIWTGTDPSQPGTPADFVINFATTSYLVKGVKIYVDTNHDLSTWEEIDAVLLQGNTSGGGGSAPATVTRAFSIQHPNVGPFATFSSSSQQISLGGSVTFAFTNQHDRFGAVAGASAFTYSFDFNNDGNFTDPGDVRDSTSPSAVFHPTRRGWNVVHGRIKDASGHYTDFWAKVFVV
jgi:hypothetical protein